MEEAPCLWEKKKFGQKMLLITRELGLLNTQLRIKREDDAVLIPLLRLPSEEEQAAITKRCHEVRIASDCFSERKKQGKTLQEALDDKLAPPLLAKLPHSMDIIGQVAIVDVDPELEEYKHQLGQAILQTKVNIKTVLAKVGAISGEFRTRDFEVIAGTSETETIYREYGCVYLLDPRDVYFSPRLSQERWKVAQQVRDGEVVVDMFAGVGPYSIQIAKKHCTAKVYAIDTNDRAIYFLNRNIGVNKVNNVYAFHGDAREVIEKNLIGNADRVIMNLPEKAIEFIDIACKALQSVGGVIHYYGFEEEPKPLEKVEEKLATTIMESGKMVKKILGSRLVRSIAPRKWQVAIDLLVI